jgi:vitamin B12 transporter
MQGAAATNTLILVDGLAINDPSGTGGLFDLRLLSTDNIERIEIIKGSQSTLYGTDAIAGVINIITRKGSSGLIDGSGQLSYGSFNTLKGNVGVNGKISPDVSYSAGYNRGSSDGISAAENPGDNESFGKDGFKMDSFFGRVDLSPLEGLTITPHIQYSTYDGDYDADAFIDAENEFSLSMFSPRLQLQYSANGLRVNADYNYTRTERTFLNSFGENVFEGRFHNVDLFGNYTLNNYIKILAGVNYQDYSIPAAQNESTPNASIASPYATVYLNDLAGFSTELGYRLNNHTEYGNNSTYSVAPSYRVTDQVKLFASVTTGFKAPTLDELFGPFGANPDLDPQKSFYTSAGIEAYFLKQSLKLSAQYFNREIDDLIIYASAGFINRDRQNDRGIELSADWIVNGSLTLGGWYNYLSGEITTEEEGREVTVSNLIRRPANSLGLKAGLQVSDNLYIRMNGEYNSERTDLYFNPANNFMAENITLDPYVLVNLYAEYGLFKQQVTLFGDVRNVLNSDFTEVYGYNTMGTALKVGAKVNF